jgi:glycosyltransferase involved in cell wall biosynthesis
MHHAYVLESEPNAQIAAQMEQGTYPRSEYYVMLQRNPMPLIDARITRAGAGRITRWLAGRRQTSLAIAHEVISSGRFTALLASGEDVGLPLILRSALLRRKPELYIIVHGSYFGSAKFQTLMRLLRTQRNVHYLCLADSLRNRLVTEFGVASTHVHNTSYAADTCFFQPSPTCPAPHRIASAGAARRDYPTLLAAVTGLNVQLTVAAGSAWFDQEIHLGGTLPPNVTARPHNYLELRELYAQSSFVVVPLLPSKNACGYAVIADAMASGRAVIATRTEAYSDFIIEGETGLYVRPGDVEDLRAKIKVLVENPDRAREMGQCARAQVEAHYTVEAYCQKMERVIFGNRMPFGAEPNA